MGPRKKEKENESMTTSAKAANSCRVESVQADHELFLQAFESMTISTSYQ